MILFVQLILTPATSQSASLSFRLEPALEKEIRSVIRRTLSPRHVPQQIFQVQQIPYTRNGKKMELVAKAVLQGQPIQNPDSISNPESLPEYEAIRLELQSEGCQNFVSHPH